MMMSATSGGGAHGAGARSAQAYSPEDDFSVGDVEETPFSFNVPSHRLSASIGSSIGSLNNYFANGGRPGVSAYQNQSAAVLGGGAVIGGTSASTSSSNPFAGTSTIPPSAFQKHDLLSGPDEAGGGGDPAEWEEQRIRSFGSGAPGRVLPPPKPVVTSVGRIPTRNVGDSPSDDVLDDVASVSSNTKVENHVATSASKFAKYTPGVSMANSNSVKVKSRDLLDRNHSASPFPLSQGSSPMVPIVANLVSSFGGGANAKSELAAPSPSQVLDDKSGAAVEDADNRAVQPDSTFISLRKFTRAGGPLFFVPSDLSKINGGGGGGTIADAEQRSVSALVRQFERRTSPEKENPSKQTEDQTTGIEKQNTTNASSFVVPAPEMNSTILGYDANAIEEGGQAAGGGGRGSSRAGIGTAGLTSAQSDSGSARNRNLGIFPTGGVSISPPIEVSHDITSTYQVVAPSTNAVGGPSPLIRRVGAAVLGASPSGTNLSTPTVKIDDLLNAGGAAGYPSTGGKSFGFGSSARHGAGASLGVFSSPSGVLGGAIAPSQQATAGRTGVPPLLADGLSLSRVVAAQREPASSERPASVASPMPCFSSPDAGRASLGETSKFQNNTTSEPGQNAVSASSSSQVFVFSPPAMHVCLNPPVLDLESILKMGSAPFLARRIESNAQSRTASSSSGGAKTTLGLGSSSAGIVTSQEEPLQPKTDPMRISSSWNTSGEKHQANRGEIHPGSTRPLLFTRKRAATSEIFANNNRSSTDATFPSGTGFATTGATRTRRGSDSQQQLHVAEPAVKTTKASGGSQTDKKNQLLERIRRLEASAASVMAISRLEREAKKSVPVSKRKQPLCWTSGPKRVQQGTPFLGRFSSPESRFRGFGTTVRSDVAAELDDALRSVEFRRDAVLDSFLVPT
ncbi:unnamed protein product [Amoebophrya sp. A25]|nr:unnamed protein product [Amoebophrya sp. A25]|eukprot:GSA25T00004473001.1